MWNRPTWRRASLDSEDLVEELKFFNDFQAPNLLTAFVPRTYMLPALTRGTAENQRVGNQVSVNWIWFSWIINTTNEAIASPSDGIVRIMLFIDHQSNGTTPTVGQLIDTTIGYVCGPYNMDNVPNRFQLLYDEVVKIPTGNVTWGGVTPAYSNGLGYEHDTCAFMGGPTPVRFNDLTSGNPANVITGNIWLWFLTEKANVRVQPAWRVHYMDF